MYLKKVDGPRTITLPDGRVMSRADLPPAETKRWVASRKAAVVRAVRILAYLAEHSTAQRLTAIAGAIGIPVSSTAAICNALEAERMIVRRNEGYVLGPLNVELAQRSRPGGGGGPGGG